MYMKIRHLKNYISEISLIRYIDRERSLVTEKQTRQESSQMKRATKFDRTSRSYFSALHLTFYLKQHL